MPTWTCRPTPATCPARWSTGNCPMRRWSAHSGHCRRRLDPRARRRLPLWAPLVSRFRTSAPFLTRVAAWEAAPRDPGGRAMLEQARRFVPVVERQHYTFGFAGIRCPDDGQELRDELFAAYANRLRDMFFGLFDLPAREAWAEANEIVEG